MPSARFEAPETVGDATKILSGNPGAQILSGGTDLIVRMRLGNPPPEVFVDVKRIDRLSQIQIDDAGLRLGAAVPAADVFRHPEISALWPGVTEATDLIGSSQIQSRATWAGNLCNASPAADSVPALIACDARAVVAGPKGERTVAVADFNLGPGRNGLEAGEFVVEFEIPRPAAHSADAYLRLIPRTEMDIAVVGAAVRVTLDGEQRVASARVVLGAVAPTAILVPDAAAALVGSTLDEDALTRAGSAASAAAQPIDDRRGSAAYRKTIAGVLTRRAARIAYDRALTR